MLARESALGSLPMINGAASIVYIENCDCVLVLLMPISGLR